MPSALDIQRSMLQGLAAPSTPVAPITVASNPLANSTVASLTALLPSTASTSLLGAASKSATAPIATPLAPTVVSTAFVCTAQDSIQGIDVYTTTRNTPINNIISALSNETSSLLKSLSGLLPSPALLDAVVSDVSTAVDAVQGAMTFVDRVKDLSTSDWTNITKSVGSGMLSSMLAQTGVVNVSPELLAGIMGVPGTPPLAELLQDNIPAVRVVLNGTVQSMLSGADYVGAQGLVNMLNQVAGDTSLSSIFDANAQSALYGTLVSTARTLGIGSSVYLTVLNQFQNQDDQNNFILGQLPDAADTCDIAFINSAVDISGAGRVIQVVPDIIQRMLKGYVQDLTLSPHDSFIDTLACIMSINPLWDQDHRSSVMATDLTAFSTASADAISALELYDQYLIPAAIAKLYPAAPAVQLGQAMWPINTINA